MLIQIIFISLCVVFSYTSAQECCTNNITKEYRLETYFKANWFDANLHCRYHGMQLATIYSQQEQTDIENLLIANGLGNETFWISLSDLAQEGTFKWFSTGNTLTSYSNWLPLQPDNNRGVEDCVCLERNLQWQDGACDILFYFICERSL